MKDWIIRLKCKFFGHSTGSFNKYAWAGRNKMRVFCIRCMQLVWIRSGN